MTQRLLQILQTCITACIVIGFVCLTASHSDAYKYEWKYEEIVSDCKPWMSVQVRIENDTNLHNITFMLSTSSVINQRVYVHTSRLNFTAKNRAPCLYHGSNAKTGDTVFASTIKGKLRMTFKYNGTWYRSHAFLNSSEPVVAKEFRLNESDVSGCHHKTPPKELNVMRLNGSSYETTPPSNPIVKRKKRSLMVQSLPNSAPQKALELVVVVDRSFVTKAGSEGNAATRVMQITNFVNGVYNTFSLRIVLTDIIIWSADPFPITSNPDTTLNSFTQYKAMQVTGKYDTIIMLSAMQWNNGATLGMAWMNSLCERIYSAGIVSDKYPEAMSTAWTLAHEIGHNLGFNHVEEVSGCTCSITGGCIMNAYLSPANRLTVLNWATCSVDKWNSDMNAPWRSCLSNIPDASYASSRSTAMCGNGLLESGEQCDCGPSATCTSSCCDASTCRFKSGAICASGPCCDPDFCTLRLKGDVCRPSLGVCDVPETCSGTSEWCPSDDKVADGVDCASGSAYCYKGQCKTTDSQCQILFSSVATTASSSCFSQLNTRGDVFGHCDLRLQSLVYLPREDTFNRSYSFASCTAANVGCGLLHCFQSTRPASGSSVIIAGASCYSQSRMDYSSSGLRSPSLVPDGAKCGSNAMCINSTCTALSTVRSCSNCPSCSGNGVLTSSNVCFCNSNFTPPYCNATGCGGSVTSPLVCFDPNRTTIRRPTTTVPASTTPQAENASSGDTIFGMLIWQFIAIMVSGAVVLIVVVAVSVHMCLRSKKKRQAASAASARHRPSPGHRPHPPPRQSQRHHPPPQRQPPRPHMPPQQMLPPPPEPRPQQLGVAPGNNPFPLRYQQHQNMAFQPDHPFSLPPPPYQAQVVPSAPPLYTSDDPFVNVSQIPQASSNQQWY